MRADARRNFDAIVEAARAVFRESGVDAPVREITTRAGVGLATFYRHFPDRSDLVTAVFRHEVDACADEAAALATALPPWEALVAWLHRFTGFVGAKRGLQDALHSGNPAFEPLPLYFRERFEPALSTLLRAAAAAGDARADASPMDVLYAISRLCRGADPAADMRMVELLIDGLRARS
ncbi:TetR/AcrR family transcriptional regulator [Dactylosporangium vinaceum]|uniref:TetR/AcrR family transcriptional regulator n=1 Tax=Dactylosporangium vinaceum TaxID=53362 RepID=A0ABV5MS79_9ACTN|nr:TetR/AcrR family transcriptional regulator [Dactylosporangium vinaceum]UAC00281.1 TetR/AcrR family transcriptional regulator [Dactylosporangium vinaceum]